MDAIETVIRDVASAGEHIHIPLFRQDSPLILYFLVVPPQTVNTEHIEQVSWRQFLQQLLIPGAVEIFPALFVYEDLRLRDIELIHLDKLPVFILVCAADSDIAIDFHMITSFQSKTAHT